MANAKILVDLQRCTGCWTCSMACMVGNKLDDMDYRVTVRTLGSGEGIDRPAGEWPNLRMSWMPIYSQKCTKCAPRLAEGKDPYCVHNCPNRALYFGEDADAHGKELRERGFRIFELPAWENSKDGIVYGSKG